MPDHLIIYPYHWAIYYGMFGSKRSRNGIFWLGEKSGFVLPRKKLLGWISQYISGSCLYRCHLPVNVVLSTGRYMYIVHTHLGLNKLPISAITLTHLSRYPQVGIYTYNHPHQIPNTTDTLLESPHLAPSVLSLGCYWRLLSMVASAKTFPCIYPRPEGNYLFRCDGVFCQILNHISVCPMLFLLFFFYPSLNVGLW